MFWCNKWWSLIDFCFPKSYNRVLTAVIYFYCIFILYCFVSVLLSFFLLFSINFCFMIIRCWISLHILMEQMPKYLWFSIVFRSLFTWNKKRFSSSDGSILLHHILHMHGRTKVYLYQNFKWRRKKHRKLTYVPLNALLYFILFRQTRTFYRNNSTSRHNRKISV